jgi:hypothetical protein
MTSMYLEYTVRSTPTTMSSKMGEQREREEGGGRGKEEMLPANQDNLIRYKQKKFNPDLGEKKSHDLCRTMLSNPFR